MTIFLVIAFLVAIFCSYITMAKLKINTRHMGFVLINQSIILKKFVKKQLLLSSADYLYKQFGPRLRQNDIVLEGTF